MVTLRAFSTQAEAALAKSVLDDHRIVSALADENVYLYGGAPLAMPVWLLVAEEHVDEANRILETGGQDRPDVKPSGGRECVVLPPARQNPWELLALALLLALPAIVLLLQKDGVVLVASYRPISRRVITFIPPGNVQVIGAFVLAAALFLVGVYLYLRRAAATLDDETVPSSKRAGDSPSKFATVNQLPNSYSPRWFEFFHFGITEDPTEKEIEFICAMAPLPQFRRVLDICCGAGGHARALAARGYAVTGVERDAAAVVKARQLEGGPDYIQKDIRDYRPVRNAYDVAIVMSQSFGYFDEATNRGLLRRLRDGLRDGGRIILDLWNPDFFTAHQGERELETPAGIVREQKKVQDGRLFVHLTYPDGAREDFEWQLFSLSDMKRLAESISLRVVGLCSGFEPVASPDASDPRTQFLLERDAKKPRLAT